jgi:hypothetical protein
MSLDFVIYDGCFFVGFKGLESLLIRKRSAFLCQMTLRRFNTIVLLLIISVVQRKVASSARWKNWNKCCPGCFVDWK